MDLRSFGPKSFNRLLVEEFLRNVLFEARMFEKHGIFLTEPEALV